MSHSHEISSQMRECIQNCFDCHRICTETAARCLTLGGKHAEAAHIRLLLDCAQICGAGADFMLRTSHFHAKVCGVCAEVCSQCADDCGRLAEGDAMMQQCAEACRRCAQSCMSMAGAHA